MSQTDWSRDVEQLATALLKRQWMVATAESCTGGWLAKIFTDIAGSSQWFDRGFITYSNDAKIDMLGVTAATIERHGAVSDETVREMANGVLNKSRAQFSVAISGIAGPSGGTKEKPVGTVWIAWGVRDASARTKRFLFNGDREQVRSQSVTQALKGLLDLIDQYDAST